MAKQELDKPVAPDNGFKEYFTKTLGESIPARKEFKNLVLEVLEEPDTVEEIKKIIDKIDRNSASIFWKNFGSAIKTSFFFILGAVFTAVISHFIK